MSKFFPLKVHNVKKETSDAVSVEFEVPENLKENFKFKHGQYLTIRKTLNGEELRRSYSICSAPYENNLKVGIKKVIDGRFSTYANDFLKPGEVLDVMVPMGNFTTKLDSKASRKYCFFASGSGITPIISIIKNILHEEKKSEITLFYGNKKLDTILFKEELNNLKDEHLDRFGLYHILSQELIGNRLFRGRIDNEKCEKFAQFFVDLKQMDGFFICGPYDMIMNVKDWLKTKSVPDEKVHFELFGVPAKKVEEKNNELVKEQIKRSIGSKEKGSCDITIFKDDDQVRFVYENTIEKILDFANDKGLDLPFSCKGGVCCTCKAKVLEGSVDMALNYALEEEEVEAGYVLTCQAVPTSERLVLSFDE